MRPFCQTKHRRSKKTRRRRSFSKSLEAEMYAAETSSAPHGPTFRFYSPLTYFFIIASCLPFSIYAHCRWSAPQGHNQAWGGTSTYECIRGRPHLTRGHGWAIRYLFSLCIIRAPFFLSNKEGKTQGAYTPIPHPRPFRGPSPCPCTITGATSRFRGCIPLCHLAKERSGGGGGGGSGMGAESL